MVDFDPTPPSTALTANSATPPQSPVRQMAPNVYQTDFNDESVQKYEFELYSGKAGTTDRIYIPQPRGVVKARTHFVERGSVKFSLICLSQYVRSADSKREDLVHEAQCCKLLGTSAPRFAALIIRYVTDKNGNITKPFQMERKLWKFGADKYRQIQQIGRDFPLEQHDLSILCPQDGEQFQKLQINAKPECFIQHPQFPADEREGVVSWAKAGVSKLPRELGRVYANEAELMRDLQQAGVLTPAGPAPIMASDVPVHSYDDIVGTIVAPK